MSCSALFSFPLAGKWRPPPRPFGPTLPARGRNDCAKAEIMAVITILGAGVMGSAMTLPARDRGHGWLVGTHLDQAIIESVAKTGRHPRLNVKLPEGVKPYPHGDFAKALGSDTDLIILGVSSAGVGWAIERLCGALTRPMPVMMITKGLMPASDTILPLPDFVQSEVKRRNEHCPRTRRGRRTLHRRRIGGAAADRRRHHFAHGRTGANSVRHARHRLLPSARLGRHGRGRALAPPSRISSPFRSAGREASSRRRPRRRTTRSTSMPPR